jgi:hypothetical protein
MCQKEVTSVSGCFRVIHAILSHSGAGHGGFPQVAASAARKAWNWFNPSIAHRETAGQRPFEGLDLFSR